MINSEHLFDRSKFRLYIKILFCFISNLVLLKNDLKDNVSCLLLIIPGGLVVGLRYSISIYFNNNSYFFFFLYHIKNSNLY